MFVQDLISNSAYAANAVSDAVNKYGMATLSAELGPTVVCGATALYSAVQFAKAAKAGNVKKACLWAAGGAFAVTLAVMSVQSKWKQIAENPLQFQGGRQFNEGAKIGEISCESICSPICTEADGFRRNLIGNPAFERELDQISPDQKEVLRDIIWNDNFSNSCSSKCVDICKVFKANILSNFRPVCEFILRG
jgi:hypothetical protein